MTGQYEALSPFITDRINALVRGRLLQGVKFFGTTALNPGFDREEVKLALLLVRIANPAEYFTQQELKMLEGGQIQKNGSHAEIIAIPKEKKAVRPKSKKTGLGLDQ